MIGFTKKVMSVVVAGATTIAPLGQAIGVRTAIGAAVVIAPTAAFAQKGHRLCGAVMEATNDHFAGVMMEVNKADFVTCGAIVMASTGQYMPSSLNLRNVINKVFMDLYHGGFPDSHLVARMERCEDATKWWFPGSFGGDVCNSMREYKLYRFFHYRNGSISISR